MSDQNLTHKELRELYARGVNIMGLFREAAGSSQNTQDSILVSYDLQSGSYTRGLENPDHRVRVENYGAEIAAILEPLAADSMLEAGVGEATTLCSVLKSMGRRPAAVGGFDISWSRLAFARDHASRSGVGEVRLFTGALQQIPLCDSSVDLVYTAHTVEPNHGHETEILHELYRIARRWLVLFEPSYELGNEATRRRIEEHGYCRGLRQLADESGWKVLRHELLRHSLSDINQTAVLVIEKNAATEEGDSSMNFACPLCRAKLHAAKGHFFCDECGRVFPIVDGIPCLLGGNGVLASKFLDFPGA